MSVGDRPLSGRRIVTTRDEPGRLDSLLAELGADVVHVPLIEIVEAADDGASLADALARIEAYDWVVVTSQHGAARVVNAVAGAVNVRVAAVGTKTAAALVAGLGRGIEIVPARHTAADLVAAMPVPARQERVLAALGDRAAPTLVDGLSKRGYDVEMVVAYRTRLRIPTAAELEVLRSADAVAFASGSAASAWAEACGSWTPPIVVAIGPTTAAAARQVGLQVSSIAADHTVEGLAAEVTSVLTQRS